MLHMIFGDDQICLWSPRSFRKLPCCENCVHRSSKSQTIPTVNSGNFQELPRTYLPLPDLSAGQYASHTKKCSLKTFQW